jgi:hypothetical protein
MAHRCFAAYIILDRWHQSANQGRLALTSTNHSGSDITESDQAIPGGDGDSISILKNGPESSLLANVTEVM